MHILGGVLLVGVEKWDGAHIMLHSILLILSVSGLKFPPGGKRLEHCTVAKTPSLTV